MKICTIKYTAIVIVLFGVSLVANGGIWESNSAKVFRLDVNSIKSYNHYCPVKNQINSIGYAR
jgi:hypothetical protein